MIYTQPLHEGFLIRRYKRFLADVDFAGETITVHCPNSGSMAGLLERGNPVRISGPHGGRRKLPFTLEQVQVRRTDGRRIWVGVNTSLSNLLLRELAEAGRLHGFEDCNGLLGEVKLGDHSRIDFRLTFPSGPGAWLEVKNCTLVQRDFRRRESVNEGAIATFPDAVTARGLKHLDLLIERVRAGERAAVVFTVQRDDAREFAPAVAYDPAYAERFIQAVAAGVKMLPLPARVWKEGIALQALPLPIFY